MISKTSRVDGDNTRRRPSLAPKLRNGPPECLPECASDTESLSTVPYHKINLELKGAKIQSCLEKKIAI